MKDLTIDFLAYVSRCIRRVGQADIPADQRPIYDGNELKRDRYRFRACPGQLVSGEVVEFVRDSFFYATGHDGPDALHPVFLPTSTRGVFLFDGIRF